MFELKLPLIKVLLRWRQSWFVVLSTPQWGLERLCFITQANERLPDIAKLTLKILLALSWQLTGDETPSGDKVRSVDALSSGGSWHGLQML